MTEAPEVGEGYIEPRITESTQPYRHNIEPTDEYWDARAGEWRPFGMLLYKDVMWFAVATGIHIAGGKIRRKAS